jgi:outer membrane protein OmpA-like peptidoglycan-associated protein
MRTPSVIAMIALSLLAALATQALAAEPAPAELGLLGGIGRLDRDVVGPGFHPDYSPVGGLRFGTSMDRKVSYFLEGLYGRFDTNVGGEKSSILETRAGLERNFAFKPSSSSNWYLAGALGWADVNMPSGGLGDFGRPLLSAGIGIRGPSDRWSRVHLELREEWWLGDDGLNGKDVANTQLLLGWSFGLRSANAPARRSNLFAKGKKSLVLEGVNFVTNSAELTPESKAILDHVAQSLKDWPGVKVEIEGHTDSVADPAYNMDLSQRRAESVLHYLESRGVASSRLSARGYGETHPIASNDTPEGRAKNRRVELRKTN